MTKEEALRKVKGYLTDYIPADNYEEVEEIVEALEQDTSVDLISRQAVEDAIYDYSRSCDVNYGQIMEYIDKIPPVPLTPFSECEEWKQLKETISEIKENNKYDNNTTTEWCRFLLNYMEILERHEPQKTEMRDEEIER